MIDSCNHSTAKLCASCSLLNTNESKEEDLRLQIDTLTQEVEKLTEGWKREAFTVNTLKSLLEEDFITIGKLEQQVETLREALKKIARTESPTYGCADIAKQALKDTEVK